MPLRTSDHSDITSSIM